MVYLTGVKRETQRVGTVFCLHITYFAGLNCGCDGDAILIHVYNGDMVHLLTLVYCVIIWGLHERAAEVSRGLRVDARYAVNTLLELSMFLCMVKSLAKRRRYRHSYMHMCGTTLSPKYMILSFGNSGTSTHTVPSTHQATRVLRHVKR